MVCSRCFLHHVKAGKGPFCRGANRVPVGCAFYQGPCGRGHRFKDELFLKFEEVLKSSQLARERVQAAISKGAKGKEDFPPSEVTFMYWVGPQKGRCP